MSQSDLANVEETMTEVRRNWNVMLQDQFNPIMVALEMLQNSNPSHDYASFMRLHGNLEEAMTIIVERYYTGFNNAVSIFGGIGDNTKEARDIVSNVKKDISEFENQIQYKRVEIPELWSQVQSYKNKFALSEKIEQIHRLQSQSLELGEKKFFIPAAKTLMDALYNARYLSSSPESNLVGDAIKKLESQRDNLFDSMVDEAHNLIYLRESNSSRQLFSFLSERIPAVKSLDVGILRNMTELTAKIGDSDLVLAPNEFDFNPKSNAVAYLSSIIRGVAVLELLPQFLSITTQRIISEMYQVTENCIISASKKIKEKSKSPSALEINFIPILHGKSMESVEVLDFYSSIPIIQNFFDNLTGQYLTVANNLLIIGETSRQIISDSGSGIDIDAFYKNCLSSIHTELKNILSLILHGGKSNSRFYANPITTMTESLKGVNLKEKLTSKTTNLYHFNNSFNPDESNNHIPSINLLSSKAEKAARKLALMLAVDPFSNLSKQEFGYRAFVTPNLHFLPILYKPFCQMNSWLESLFPEIQGNTRFIDESFVENLLNEDYIPLIESFVREELDNFFNNSDSLIWHDLQPIDQTVAIGKESNCIVQCVSVFIGLFCKVACLLYQIPGSQEEIEQVLSRLTFRFIENCENKFSDLTRSKSNENDSKSFTAISFDFIQNSSLFDLLSNHSMLTGSEDESLDTALAEKEMIMLEKLKSDRSLPRNEIIFDYKVIRSIALFQRSLELFPEILCNASFGCTPNFPKHRPELKFDDSGRLTCSFFDGFSRGMITLSESFKKKYQEFIKTIERLSKQLLFLLRIELRIHCFYFLELAYREGSYDFEDPCNEPDLYVSNLANDLIRFESLMVDRLPYSRYHVVMDELHVALNAMLISDFRHIRSLNTHGLTKLELNLTTLEQILSFINTGTFATLERAREFYTLAGYGPEKFIEMAPKMKEKFTMPQYQSIFDVYYRDTTGDASIRRTYANQLVRLKYLIDDQHETPRND